MLKKHITHDDKLPVVRIPKELKDQLIKALDKNQYSYADFVRDSARAYIEAVKKHQTA